MFIATNGEIQARVRVYHWWPEKEWWGECPIPAFITKRAREKESKYLTYAEVMFEAIRPFSYALCCPRDAPSRKMGRTIAFGRLNKELESFGFRLEEK